MNGHVRLLRQLLRSASHDPPHFLWPLVSRYHNWGRVSYKPRILQFMLLWRHWTSPTTTNGSLRQTITDTVSTSVIYYSLVHRFAISLWCLVLCTRAGHLLILFHFTLEYSYFSSVSNFRIPRTTAVLLIKDTRKYYPSPPPKKSIIGFVKSSSMYTRKCLR